MRRTPTTIMYMFAAMAGLPPVATADELCPPVHVIAGLNPIDVERDGHAAPFVGDIDGDGRRDLLVGEYHEGRLRIFRNVGSDNRPRFDESTWFRAGSELGRVPTG